MKNLSILILLLFASSLFAGEFKGSTSITIGGVCPESMVSMLEDGSNLCFLKDGPGYVVPILTLTKAKKTWEYKDSALKASYTPKNKKFSLKIKNMPTLWPETGNEEVSESMEPSQYSFSMSGTLPYDIEPELEEGASVGVVDADGDFTLFGESWPLSQKGWQHDGTQNYRQDQQEDKESEIHHENQRPLDHARDCYAEALRS